MSLYDSDRRYRRRFWSGIIRFGIFAGMLGGTAFISYQAGIEELDSNVRGYQREIHELESQQNALEQETANLRVATERARLAIEEWERRYDADVATGIRHELLELLTERLNAGVSPERLKFLVQAARSEEHKSALQSLMRISSAVFCVKKKK